MTKDEEIENCLNEFMTETCNLVFNAIMPFDKFNIDNILVGYDHTKYLKTIGHLEEIDFINITYLSFGKKEFNCVKQFMKKQGYIKRVEDINLKNTFELTDIGRLAKRLGGHDKYLRHLKLDDVLKEQLITINKSVIRTNLFTVLSGSVTLIIAILSIYYIIQTFILQSKDKSEKELEGIKIELSTLRKYMQKQDKLEQNALTDTLSITK